VNKILGAAQDGLAGSGETPLGPLRKVAESCANSSCPTVYVSAAGTLVVQGYVVSAERAGISVPEGEMLVEIPIGLLAEAARDLT
jgi:hypothetical protein